jgi:CheY-like chemotaxis protein
MNCKILIIGTNQEINSSIEQIFQSNGCQILQTASGQEGLHLVNTQSPAVAVVDLQLQDMDAYEVIRQLRSRAERFFPVIAVIDQPVHQVAEKVLAAGSDILITFPVEEDNLRVKLEAFIPRE